jgi:hypothetical protein
MFGNSFKNPFTENKRYNALIWSYTNFSFFCVYGLLYNAIITSVYIASNDRMIGVKLIGKRTLGSHSDC